jgi:hypothetical protein
MLDEALKYAVGLLDILMTVKLFILVLWVITP